MGDMWTIVCRDDGNTAAHGMADQYVTGTKNGDNGLAISLKRLNFTCPRRLLNKRHSPSSRARVPCAPGLGVDKLT